MATILVVDDDEASLAIVTGLMCAAGHTAFGVSCGRDALLNGEYQTPDVILCDVMMPGMDGRQVLQEFRHLGFKHVPIVAVTALATPGEREKLLAAGFDGYISKPIMPRTFARQVESYLDYSLVPPRGNPSPGGGAKADGDNPRGG